MSEKLKKQLEEILNKASKRIESKLEVKCRDLLSQFLNKTKTNKYDRDNSS